MAKRSTAAATSKASNGKPKATGTSGPAAVAASPIDWLAVARQLLVSRALDHIEESKLVPGGLITYQFSSRGHDLAQILLGVLMNHPHDAATVY